ncbi:conserved hypothetical protein [Hyphomicrobiales bacterium]|nr:conserved hypothetical protein [Hyphomicrobiales bacterium]
MVAFYKHDIPAWMDGTEELSDGEYRAYHVICQLIYLHEAPIARNERGIAGRCNQRLTVFRKHLEKLLGVGKLEIIDGRISNARCGSELAKISVNRSNAAAGGASGKTKKSGEVVVNGGEQQANDGRSGGEVDANGGEDTPTLHEAPPKPLENNDAGEAPLARDLSLKEKKREEKTIEEDASSGKATNEEKVDIVLWMRGAVGTEPVALATDDWQITNLLDEGCTRQDIETGIAAAMAAPNFRLRYWNQLKGWVTRAAQDRLAQSPKDPAAKLAQTPMAPPSLSDDDWRTYVTRWKQADYWVPRNLSEEPNHPKTLVPEHILAEFGISKKAAA